MTTKNLSIFAELRLKDVGAFRREFRSVAASVGKARQELGRLTDGLRGLGGTVLATAGIGGIAYGVSSLVKQLVTVPAAADDARRGLAVLIQQSFGVTDWGRATAAAESLRDRLREIAAVSPGTLDDYMESVRDLAIVAKGTGATLDDLARLTQTVVATQKVGGYQQGVVSRDIRQLLGGQGSSAAIQVAGLKPIANEVAALARAGQKAEALRRIVETLQVSPDALASFEQSFDAQITTLQSNWQQFLERAGGPLVSALVTRLQTVNRWIAANGAKVGEYAKAVGTFAVRAVERLVSGVKWLSDNWEGVLSTVKTLATVWVGVKLLDAVTTVGRAAVAIGGALKVAFTGALGPLGVMLAGVTAVVAKLQSADDKLREREAREREARKSVRERLVGQALAAGEDTVEGRVLLRRAREVAERDLRAAASRLPLAQRIEAGMTAETAARGMVAEDLRRAREEAAKRAQEMPPAAEGALLDQIKAAAEAGIVANIDQRGARIEVRQDFRQADPDAVFFAMSRDVARESLRVVSPYSPGGR